MRRWLFTGLSFAAVAIVSAYAVISGAPAGVSLAIPAAAHALALAAFAAELAARSLKLTLSARAVGASLPFLTAVRTSLGGDFGAAVTPARSGAEPARFLILAEAGVSASVAMVVLYAELVLEMFSLAIVVAVLAIVVRDAGAATVAMIGVIGGYATFVITVGVIAVVLARRAVGDAPPAWARRIRLHGERWAKVQGWLARLRVTVDAFGDLRPGWAVASLLASVTHIVVRLTILPAIVLLASGAAVPLGPLVVWPLGIVYGAAVVPAPAGGGAIELAFRATLGGVIPAAVFGAALVWWRFYTFYLYVALGALVAGGTALRAVRGVADAEERLERA